MARSRRISFPYRRHGSASLCRAGPAHRAARRLRTDCDLRRGRPQDVQRVTGSSVFGRVTSLRVRPGVSHRHQRAPRPPYARWARAVVPLLPLSAGLAGQQVCWVTDLRATLERTLGDSYTFERELVGGGMSRVFVAMDRNLGRQIIVKVLPADVAAELSVERFRREIHLAAKLQHPHIVPVLSAGEVNGLPYFTMPFVEGESLRSRLSRVGELPVAEAVRILREVASAISYAHKHGVAHRDIKPENVMLSDEFALVTDFGVAKALSESTKAPGSGTLTGLGVTLGTPAYMAPEQVAADPSVDHRADIYSFGVMAYEMLTGSHPFAGRTMQQMLAAHAVEKPEPIERRRPSVPHALAALVTRCLEKRPAGRPQSAVELLATLDSVHADHGEAGKRDAGSGKRRVRIMAAVAGIVVVAGGALYAVAVRDRGSGAAEQATQLHSVAVLPLAYVGGDAKDEYLSDGMTDALANRLRKRPSLRVASRTSA